MTITISIIVIVTITIIVTIIDTSIIIDTIIDKYYCYHNYFNYVRYCYYYSSGRYDGPSLFATIKKTRKPRVGTTVLLHPCGP